MADTVTEIERITDPILLSLIDLTKECEASGDPETLMCLHSALQARCIAVGLDAAEVERRYLGMDTELDFPSFN